MKVELLTHTPNPEKTCALAAKLCYSQGMPDMKKLTPDKALPFLEKILSLGHLSVLEHASFTFAIEGISRACSHQLVRHRIASFSQQSQRYVKATDFDYVMPNSITKSVALDKGYHAVMNHIETFYRAMLKEGIPAEDARFILPNAAETKLVMTMNARELLHFFSLRCCVRAQWEIRAMAKEMLKLVQVKAPVLFKTAGAGCVRGVCPEGVMGCNSGN